MPRKPKTPVQAMSDKSNELLLAKIKKLKGHNKSIAIEKFVKGANSDNEKISILIFALNDDDYSFCHYEGCVRSAASYLYDLRDSLTNSEDRRSIVNILLESIDDCLSNIDDSLDRIRLLGVFKREAISALGRLKSILNDFDDDSEYSSEEWYQNSFEFECRSILKESIDSIENK